MEIIEAMFDYFAIKYQVVPTFLYHMHVPCIISSGVFSYPLYQTLGDRRAADAPVINHQNGLTSQRLD